MSHSSSVMRLRLSWIAALMLSSAGGCCSLPGSPPRWCAGLTGYIRDGGIVAFQEPANATLAPMSLPHSQLLERIWGWILETYRRADMDLFMGLRLRSIFAEAGLPAPEMHLDAAAGGGPDWPGIEYMARLIRTILPQITKLGSRQKTTLGSTRWQTGCALRSATTALLSPGASSPPGLNTRPVPEDQRAWRHSANAELADLRSGPSPPPGRSKTHRVGDLISYQNDRKYSTAGSRKAGRS